MLREIQKSTAPKFVISSPKCSHDSLHHDEPLDPETCPHCAFQVAWSINPHMKIGASVRDQALHQHKSFRSALHESGAEVIELPFVHGAYDSVFVKDNAVLAQRSKGVVAFLANPFTNERKREQDARRAALEERGFEVCGSACENFEGGDLVVLPEGKGAFLGYGFRSTREAADEVANFLDARVVPLQLRDPHFYHLDTALAVLNDGTAFACRDAFTDEAWETLGSDPLIRDVMPVSREEAMRFGLNWVEVGNSVLIGSEVPGVIKSLESLGKRVIVTPLGQFQLAGGSAACLTAQVHRLM